MERKSASIFSNCPYEVPSVVSSKAIANIPTHIPREINSNVAPSTAQEVKANPMRVTFADETTRGAINKATMPFYMIKPPFGLPRFKNIDTLRRLGNVTQARMAKQTIIDEIVTVPWDIVPMDDKAEISPELENKIKEVKTFFMNPNTNNESLEYLLRPMLEDNLDFDSGIWVKEFDQFDRMVELRYFDGATFLKNPNIYGKYDDKADVIPSGTVLTENGFQLTFDDIGRDISATAAADAATNYGAQQGISLIDARQKAAYFQFPFAGGMSITANVRPIAFGRREIVWFESNPQSFQVYGKSPAESMLDVLQTLQYSIEYNLDYFEDNNVPKGFIQLTGADEEEMDAFRDRWNELQLKTNSQGLLKKNFHRVPITNVDNASFVRIQFSAAELELIESQKWFSNLCWATYGVNPSELGFTENSNLATETGQGRKFKKKAILPRLRMIEYFINNNIISEWDFNDEIKFQFNTFDIEDEKSKMDLYEKQISTGFKTVNEIRVQEGLEELEEEVEENVHTLTDEDLDKDRDPKDPDPEESKKKADKKAGPTLDSVIDEFNKQLDLDKKKIITELRKNSDNRLTQIKSFSTLFAGLQGLFNFDRLKSMIRGITNSLFGKGIEEAETLVKAEGITVNAVSSSPEKVNFLSQMSLENVKGLGAEARLKLNQQLKIGISQGEGIGTLTERVQKVFNTTKLKAGQMAHMQQVRIKSQGQLHAAEQIQADGVNVKKWLLWTLDARTSPLTKALHAKYGSPEQAIPISSNFKIDFQGKSISQNAPPFHFGERDEMMTLIVDKGEN